MGGYIDEETSEERNTVFVNALRHGHGPDTFIWRGIEAKNRKFITYDLDHIHAKEMRAESLRVSRDAMGCCGVRADLHDQYGCRR
jgi:hypothetical protein